MNLLDNPLDSLDQKNMNGNTSFIIISIVINGLLKQNLYAFSSCHSQLCPVFDILGSETISTYVTYLDVMPALLGSIPSTGLHLLDR